MSLEGDSIQRTASPLSSGRSSPVNNKSKLRDEDGLLKKDKGYRRYASTIERVLGQFDTAVEEWADYISFLGRLLKALSSKPTGFTEIPHKVLVAKRLSQCLNPTLPSGVHQKTLEVYAYIFSSLGKEALSSDLSLYLPGLTPTLSFAALSVKPNILSLYETFIVTLKPASVRPALRSLILSLLPGLEEENSDEFERTLRILGYLKLATARGEKRSNQATDSSNDQYFWQCMFLACITSSSRRAGGLAYLTRNLPRLGAPSSQETTTSRSGQNGHVSESSEETKLHQAIEAVVSPEPGLLIRCFCAGLRDDQLLIQRGFLDLLVTNLPLSSVVLQEKVVPKDLEKLISAATSVVARRDMSLNRRLWSWFLGPEPVDSINGSMTSPTTPRSNGPTTPAQDSIAVQTQYFEKYGLGPLKRGLQGMIDGSSENPLERTRPLRICLSLMDRWEIGGLVIHQIFLPAMSSVWRYQNTPVSEESHNEVLRSANMFFDGVESGLIWAELAKLVAQAFDSFDINAPEACQMLELVFFMVINFNIREEEMQVVHIPLVAIYLLLRISSRIRLQKANDELGNFEIVTGTLKIVNRLLELVPQRALIGDKSLNGSAPSKNGISSGDEMKYSSSIERFYNEKHGNIDMGQPISSSEVGQILLHSSFEVFSALLNLDPNRSIAGLDLIVSILTMAVRKGPRTSTNLENFLATLSEPSEESSAKNHIPFQSFAIMSAKVSAFEAIMATPHSSKWIPDHLLRQAVPALVARIWPSTSPSRPKYNVEAVRSIWRLHAICPDPQLVESTIMSLMISKQAQDDSDTLDHETARRFTILWAHSPPTASTPQSRRSSLIRAKPDLDQDGETQSELSLLERPLMLVLDVLEDPKCALFSFVVNWLQSLSSLVPIVSSLISRLSSLFFISSILPASDHDSEKAITMAKDDDPDGLKLCLYYLQSILHVIQYSTANVWPALASPTSIQVLKRFPSLDGQSNDPDSEDLVQSNQVYLSAICIRLLQARRYFPPESSDLNFRLDQTLLSLLRQFLLGPLSASLIDREIEVPLLEELTWSVEHGDYPLQPSLMEVILASFKTRLSKESSVKSPKRQRAVFRDTPKTATHLSIVTDVEEKQALSSIAPTFPIKLLECLILGLTSQNSRPVLDSWIAFLGHCLPLYEEGIFQILLPLVECFCNNLESVLKRVQSSFLDSETEVTDMLDPTIALLLNGLEQSLATAHDCLTPDEAGNMPAKTPEQQQTGFFGTMVSGVFTNETNRSKTMTANNRLTVLLCFKDAVRICYSLWSWGDPSQDNHLRASSATASFNYITLRLRNRTRRILEHIFAAEPLECLEPLIELWQSNVEEDKMSQATAIFDLLSVLESSRPKNTKNTIPAIFNAIYSRTNPAALEPSRKSTLTSALSDTVLAAFLVAYTKSLDDDAMDEIWNDCLTFLKDVLANPMPHRQTLARLLEFTAVLGEKVDNTTFGEQRKMRRELGDLFVRLLTATLTIKPMGFSSDTTTSGSEKTPADSSNGRPLIENRSALGSEGLVSVLATITPNLSKILIDSDRVATITNTISTQVLGPVLRSKIFPENVNQRTIDLMVAISSIPEASKFSKRDIAEAFNDPRFFASSLELVSRGWLPMLRSWSLADKERMPELLSRLTSPTAAGIMFGVGATSARLEADRKTQLNLRRIALLIAASERDIFVVNLASLQEKIIDLLNATPSSSPSSTTRAEIYMVIRALILKTSTVHLSSFWPVVNAELFDAISSAYPNPSNEAQNVIPLLQACKLLDTLLTLGIDDFQMQEWLFISDTTDAVYRPPDLRSIALVDELAEGLDSESGGGHVTTTLFVADTHSDKRKPLLTSAVIKDVEKERVLEKVLRPFFRQLSIHAFESTYSMESADWQACFDELVADLFDDSTLV